MTIRNVITPLQHYALLLFVALATAFAPLGAAQAQGGPPQYVRDAVDRTIEMLRADDADAAEAFVDTTLANVSPDQRDAMIERVQAIQAAVGGLPDGVDVEGRPGGVTLMLEGAAGRQMLHLDITPEGVTRIELEQDDDDGGPPQPANSADGRAEQHLVALEQIDRLDWNDFVAGHLSPAYVAETGPAGLETIRAQLVNAASNAAGAGVEIQGDIYKLNLGSPDGRWTVAFTVEPEAPFAIRTLSVTDANANLSLPEITRDNLDEVLAMAEEAGLDGVVYVNVRGEELARTALGFSDRSLGRPMELDQIFGVGSQPIDYTVALALIAASEGHLSLDAPISRYVGDVPPDKAGMTVRNLLENMSGLPDFVDNEQDWDPDLTWITRDDFVDRILNAPLRFTPGERRGHSHAGFSFLAALVEIATERPYYDYLKEKILDPAGMTHTGMYGDRMDFAVEDFAVGGGASIVGLPNIPPNWGPTSWLVKGSGGMYSTLEDMLRFTHFVQTSEQMPASVRTAFSGETVNFNGSMRGFEMFEYRMATDTHILIFSNSPMGLQTYRDLAQRLEQFGSMPQS